MDAKLCLDPSRSVVVAVKVTASGRPRHDYSARNDETSHLPCERRRKGRLSPREWSWWFILRTVGRYPDGTFWGGRKYAVRGGYQGETGDDDDLPGRAGGFH